MCWQKFNLTSLNSVVNSRDYDPFGCFYSVFFLNFQLFLSNSYKNSQKISPCTFSFAVYYNYKSKRLY